MVFKNYYFNKISSIPIPLHVEQREFGYMTFEDTMIRHIKCSSPGEVRAMLVKESPKGVYASVSYYEFPEAPMEEKSWLGGDIAFDIDSDALNLPCKKTHDFYICQKCGDVYSQEMQNCPVCKGSVEKIGWVCDNCISAAKKELVKLLAVLDEDFGIRRDDIDVYFSGNGGYHLHIIGSNYEKLDQAARAEMAEYISGKGMTPKSLGFTPRWAIFNRESIPSEYSPGWRGRLARHLAELYDMPAKDAFLRVVEDNGNRTALFIEKVIDMLAPTIDSAVTADIHRIFRMPGTLHNKSGLIKKKVRSLDEDPFLTSVAFDEEAQSVYVVFAPRFSLAGKIFGPYKREKVYLPTYAAVYLMMKGLAYPVN